MKTYEISKSDIQNMEIISTGYKAVLYDNSTSVGNFRYGNKNERIFKAITEDE